MWKALLSYLLLASSIAVQVAAVEITGKIESCNG
jgi:hypothetical protein